MLDTYLKARYGTTVLAVRTNNEIIIGADSKATYGMLLKNYEKASVYQCEGKIHQAGAFFFSCSGLTGYEQQRFDAFDLARSVIKEGRTVSEIMMNLEQALGCSLFDAILDIHRKAPALLDPLLPEKGIKLSILVAGIENGLPVLALREFNPVIPSDPPECVINRNDNIRNDDGTPATWAIGAFDCIRQTLDDDPTFLQKNGHIAEVRKLIQLEIDRHPEKVGPPIAVLRIDRNGPRWIERTPYCNPVRKFKP